MTSFNYLTLLALLFISFNAMATQKNDLFEAVSKGDAALVEKLIQQGVDVNASTCCIEYPGETALMFAAQESNNAIIKRLIQAGADVNAIAYRDFPHAGNPVLRYAIDNGSLDAVNLLLQAGANPNEMTESPVVVVETGSSANERNINLLSHAINGHASSDIIKTLIAHGADINYERIPKGLERLNFWTPLMIAALRGYDQAVQLLLDAGADVSLVNKKHGDRTVLDYAREGGFSKIVTPLQEHHFKSKSCKVKLIFKIGFKV